MYIACKVREMSSGRTNGELTVAELTYIVCTEDKIASAENYNVPTALGELETCVLLATLRLGEQAYGVSIRDEIRTRTGRGLSRGAIYSAITRLERRGLLGSSVGDPTPVRGGRAKRSFKVTPAGIRAVRASTDAVVRMRQGLEALLSGS